MFRHIENNKMELYQIFQQYPIICTDSRNCPKNSIFFALKGDNFDANSFAAKALENGCAFAVIDDAKYAVDERYVIVDNVLIALQQLATKHREIVGTKVIGITGTNGKTTTKELIASVLSEKFNVLFTQGNFNNHIGVPLTLLQIKSEHEIAVIEMGANHPGEIQILSEIACPDYGIITNVGKAHLEGFGSFEGVQKTKAELYNYIFAHGKGIYINSDNLYLRDMASKVGFSMENNSKVITYSLQPVSSEAQVVGKVSSCSPFLEMECSISGETIQLKTNLIGAYNAENVLAAVSIAWHQGMNLAEIKAGIEKYNPTNNRSQLTITERNTLIADAYNANPTSLKAAIENFGAMSVSPKVMIIGDMFELGSQSEVEHQAIIELINHYSFEKVYLVGSRFQKTKSKYATYETVEELIEVISKNELLNKNYILIKGSRGVKLEKIIPYL